MCKYLNSINSPEDIRQLKVAELPLLCQEIRHYIIEKTAQNPGHLGASLGTVELTVALHYVFNTPDDKLIWDVGHQAYAHKIITGRRLQFATNRHYKSISGFPKMSESEYDAFGTGHSSTSISAALGMAIASQLNGNFKRKHIAVIGDASICGGEAFEAMNHAGSTNANLLIVLNDNRIAIDQSVGAIKNYLLKITSSPRYNRFKNKLYNVLTGNSKRGNRITKIFQVVGNAIKVSILRQSNLFQSLGFRYFGPIDGHNVMDLVKVFQDLKNIEGPILLHAITIKGKGLLKAEENQTEYHAPGLYNPETGELIAGVNEKMPPKYQDVFGDTLIELAEKNPQIVGITPAMASGCSMIKMMQRFPDRAFDVGIAEQHAVTFAAGLATQGKIPYCNIYSSFLQRAFDQVIHDVALQKIPVIFCIDRAGLVGEDGATHHGVFDMSFLRSVPNIVIASPLNEAELRNMMYSAQFIKDHAIVIRYPRGRGVMMDWKTPMQIIEEGRAEIIQQGQRIAVLTIGPEGNKIRQINRDLMDKNIYITHVNMRYIKPIDEIVLHQICQQHEWIITVENGMLTGGLASAVQEFMIKYSYCVKFKAFGIEDIFVEHGHIDELQKKCHFTQEDIYQFIVNL